jgi:hypothetical protein
MFKIGLYYPCDLIHERGADKRRTSKIGVVSVTYDNVVHRHFLWSKWRAARVYYSFAFHLADA